MSPKAVLDMTNDSCVAMCESRLFHDELCRRIKDIAIGKLRQSLLSRQAGIARSPIPPDAQQVTILPFGPHHRNPAFSDERRDIGPFLLFLNDTFLSVPTT